MKLVGIKRGLMTAEEKAEIERLAASLKKPTPGAIATKLNRHPSTVAWYMICNGLIERKVRYSGWRTITRKDGRQINRYSPEQDRRLVQLRASEKPLREIAEIMTREFGVRRNYHSVQVRLTMLAAYAGGPEDQVA